MKRLVENILKETSKSDIPKDFWDNGFRGEYFDVADNLPNIIAHLELVDRRNPNNSFIQKELKLWKGILAAYKKSTIGKFI